MVSQTITRRRFALGCVVCVLAGKKRTGFIGAHITVVTIQGFTTAISSGSVATEVVDAIIRITLFVDLTGIAVGAFGLTISTPTIISRSAMAIHETHDTAQRLIQAVETARARRCTATLAALPRSLARFGRREGAPSTLGRCTLCPVQRVANLAPIRRALVHLARIVADACLRSAAIRAIAHVAKGRGRIQEPIAIGRFAHQIVEIMGARMPLRALIGGAHVAIITIAVLFAAALTSAATKSVLAMVGYALVVRGATVPIVSFRGASLQGRAKEAVLTT